MKPWILLPVCLFAEYFGYTMNSVTLVFEVDMKPVARPVNAGLRDK